MTKQELSLQGDAVKTHLCILHLEDDPQDAELVRTCLEKEGFTSMVVIANTREQFERAMDEEPFDLILSDYALPGYNGLEALSVARVKQPEAPFILISGTLGEDQAVDSLKSGATDYVLKDRLFRLAPAVRRALKEAEATRQSRQAAAEIERIQKQLLHSARQAGMAEVATGVLHNVGNVLNSVNVACSCLIDQFRKSRISNLAKVATMLGEHKTDLGAFLTTDIKGKQLPAYLAQLSDHLAGEQDAALKELAQLRENVEHVKEIITMQQSLAKVSGGSEALSPIALVKEALRMNADSLSRHGIQIIQQFDEVPPITTERHKVLQILVNLLRNAQQACDDSARPEKKLTVSVSAGNERIIISVADNGIGIPPENLGRIFGHGFTTRKDGHGFGLHSGALAAKELGGVLNAHSEGAGQGATFTLDLPVAAVRAVEPEVTETTQRAA